MHTAAACAADDISAEQTSVRHVSLDVVVVVVADSRGHYMETCCTLYAGLCLRRTRMHLTIRFNARYHSSKTQYPRLIVTHIAVVCF